LTTAHTITSGTKNIHPGHGTDDGPHNHQRN